MTTIMGMEFTTQMLIGAALVVMAFMGVIFGIPFQRDRDPLIWHILCMIMGLAGCLMYMDGTMTLVYPHDIGDNTTTESTKS